MGMESGGEKGRVVRLVQPGESADGAGCFRDADDSLLAGLGAVPWLCLL